MVMAGVAQLTQVERSQVARIRSQILSLEWALLSQVAPNVFSFLQIPE